MVKEPMILGHEAAGIILEKGSKVSNLSASDLVCMDPVIPSAFSPDDAIASYEYVAAGHPDAVKVMIELLNPAVQKGEADIPRSHLFVKNLFYNIYPQGVF